MSLRHAIRFQQALLGPAREELASAFEREQAAKLAYDLALQAIHHETERATSLLAMDADVEALSRWLPGARVAAEIACKAYDVAQSDTARARAAVSAAQSAIASMEAIVERRATAVAVATSKASESETMDALSRPRRAVTRD